MVVKGSAPSLEIFWASGIEEIYTDGSFCTEKPDPGDANGYWVEPMLASIPTWIESEPVLVPHMRKWKWRMWVDHGVEFIHPAMQAGPEMASPEFFRQERDGQPCSVIQVKSARS